MLVVNPMIEVLKNTLLIISALLPIVNPLSSTPIFLLLTRDYDSATRFVLARRIALNSFFLLIVSLVVGTHILSFFGISLPVVQVGGGLVVISTGWMMLNRRDEDGDKGSSHHAVDRNDILSSAFYPLTLPLTVGPGSISVAITLGANAPHHHGLDLLAFISALAGSLIVSITVFLCYGSAERIGRLVGPTGMSVILRLSSFLLVCIGVQILWNGASVLLASVLAHPH
jgi:multiple antibiotic resistance protein